MAQQRLPVRKIRDMLRLSAAGMSKRMIAAGHCIGATATGECLRRAREAGVGWPLPDDMTDAGLEARLYPASTVLADINKRLDVRAPGDGDHLFRCMTTSRSD